MNLIRVFWNPGVHALGVTVNPDPKIPRCVSVWKDERDLLHVKDGALGPEVFGGTPDKRIMPDFVMCYLR